MDTLRLKNLRSLADTSSLEIRPLTLLLGKNSSGKSTFLRCLPLIKQSVETRSTAPLLWYGDFVDFGSYSEAHSKNSPDELISFQVGFKRLRLRLGGLYERATDTFLRNVTCKIDLGETDGTTRLRAFTLSADDDELRVELDARANVTSIMVHGVDLSSIAKRLNVRVSASEVIPQVFYRSSRPDRGIGFASRRGADLIEAEISRFLRPHTGNRIAETTLYRMIRRVRFTPLNEFADSLHKARSELVTWNRVIDLVTKSKTKLRTLHSLYLLRALPEIMIQLERRLNQSAWNIAYIGPSRATGERYYRFQELGVEQIDPQGKNLAMYLNSLSKVALGGFSDWLLSTIGHAIKLERSAGHVQILLQERDSDEFFNVADMGYGFSQILPILAQIWSSLDEDSLSVNGSIVAIEQPELHLHPAYQAHLADLMARVIQLPVDEDESEEGSQEHPDNSIRPSGLKLVVETHSETLISRLGELVAQGVVSPSFIAIYIFSKDETNNVTSVESTFFLEDGTLERWPIGFFSPIPA